LAQLYATELLFLGFKLPLNVNFANNFVKRQDKIIINLYYLQFKSRIHSVELGCSIN